MTGDCGAELELCLSGVGGAELDRCRIRVSGGGGGSEVELKLRRIRCGGGAELELGWPCISGGGGVSDDVDCRRGTLVPAEPVDKYMRNNIVR